MNQPSGSCLSTWQDEVTHALQQVHVVTTSVNQSHASEPAGGSPEGSQNPLFDSYDRELGLPDPDIPMDTENERDDSYPHHNNQEFAQVDPDLDLAPDVDNQTRFRQGTSDSFVEAYEGCSEAFPGGKSFLENFRQDRHAAERRNNLYYPFASREEWEFASWLLRSRLSISAIDSLLGLDIVCTISIQLRELYFKF